MPGTNASATVPMKPGLDETPRLFRTYLDIGQSLFAQQLIEGSKRSISW
jgi:hypothetical protein